jgi:hypothetical protein
MLLLVIQASRLKRLKRIKLPRIIQVRLLPDETMP